jgi:hypothetical protein
LAFVRQLFTWRFVAVIGALAGLVLLVNAVFASDDELAAVVEPETQTRKIDLISSVLYTDSSDDFRILADGTTRGFIDFVLDDRRVMRVAPGTPGEIACDDLDGVSECAVFAELLGEAVIWFGVLPKAPRETVELPPIQDLEDGYALFENGWMIPFPPVIERICEGEDIVNFSDFLRRFGPGSTSVVDLALQQVTQVRCAGNDAPEPATTVPDTVVLLPEDLLAPDDSLPSEG